MAVKAKRYDPLKPKTNGFDVFNLILMFLLSFCALFPLYDVLLVSTATSEGLSQHLIYVLPYSFTMKAYQYVFSTPLISHSFLISVFVTLVSTLLSMAACTAAAYVLSKPKIPGAKLMFAFVIIPMYFSGGLIPYYLTIKSYGLIDNLLVMILPTLFDTFNLILLKNFFEDLPLSVEESAKIDGANDIVVLYRIVIPMSKPVIATVSLFFAVNKWNDYFTGLLYINNNNLKPLQTVLHELLSNFTNMSAAVLATLSQQSQIVSRSVQMAIIVVAIVPIFCVYPFLQKYFTKGIMLGAVKE